MEKLEKLLEALGLSAATDTKSVLIALNEKPITLYNSETGEYARWQPLIIPNETNILRTIKGDWLVDQQAIIDNFRSRGVDMAIDYEHQGLGARNGDPMPAPASGWIKDMANVHGVVFALVEWTPRAQEYIKGGEYRYLSPAIITSEDGVVIALFNVALTNVPATIDAIPIMLSGIAQSQYNAAKGGKESNYMDRAALIATLGLSVSATDADIFAAIQALRDGHSRTATALSLSANASSAEIEGKITALSANSTQLAVAQEELNKIKLDAKQKEATALVADALKAGKITPAQEGWAKEYALSSLDGFKVYVATAQPVVPLGAGLKPDDKQQAGTVTGLSALDKEVMKNLGVGEEDMKKYGGTF